MLKMEKPHAHDENEQPCTMQKGYAMLRSKQKCWTQNVETLYYAENTQSK